MKASKTENQFETGFNNRYLFSKANWY